MMHHSKLVFATLCLTCSLPDTALAQETEDPEQETKLERLVVTAQFREETPVEVPIAITAYGQGFLDQVGAGDLDALSSYVPGLLVQEQSVNNPGFVIRGITSDNGAANIEPRVSVFQNGVSISRSRGSYVPLYDVERIEVLKGPQGTLFGRSAQIGAVHVITQKPRYRVESFGRAEVGNFGQREFDGMVNAPLLGNELAMRVAATYRERDGFITNNTGGDLNGADTQSLRGSLRWDVASLARIDLIAHYTENDTPGTSFKSGVIPALGGNTNPNDSASLNTFGGLLEGRELGVVRDLFDVTAIIDWDLAPGWNLESTTAWREFDSFETFDPDGTAFDLFVFGEHAEGEQLSSDLRMTWSGREGITAFFGAGYFDEQGSQRVPLGFDGALVGTLFNGIGAQGPVEDGRSPLLGDPNLARAFLTGDPAVVNSLLGQIGIPPGLFQEEQFTNFADNQSYDVFADASFEATDRLTLTGGLRYTYDRKETRASAGLNVNNPALGNQLVPNIEGVVSSRQDPDIDDSFDGLAWRLVADYAWNDSLHGYVNYARGRRPEVIQDVLGQIDPTIGQPIDFEKVPAERVDSYEVGLKGLFLNRRLQLNLAAFYYDYENFQTSVAVGGVAGEAPDFQLVNAGTASSQGLETQMVFRATDNLSINATYTYNRSRFDRTDDAGNLQEFADNRFRLSPDHSGSLTLNYERRLGNVQAYVSPSWTVQSDVFFEDANQRRFIVFDPATGADLFEVPAVRQAGYGLLNLRAGVSLMNDRLTIEGFATNLLDKDYVIDAGNTGGNFGIPTFIAGAPRFYGVSARLEY